MKRRNGRKGGKPVKTHTPQFTRRQVLYSFYLTQSFLLVLGTGILWWQGRLNEDFFDFYDIKMWGWGIGFGCVVVGVDLLLYRWGPARWWDDGGINRLLFAGRSALHVLLIAATAGISEEIFFRGAMQTWLGMAGSTVLFVLLHTRYWRYWLLVLMVTLISLGLGFMTERTEVLAPAVIAHAWIDFWLGLFMRNEEKKEG
jgi:membrane protease YdiL (CAAX protease family)